MIIKVGTVVKCYCNCYHNTRTISDAGMCQRKGIKINEEGICEDILDGEKVIKIKEVNITRT